MHSLVASVLSAWCRRDGERAADPLYCAWINAKTRGDAAYTFTSAVSLSAVLAADADSHGGNVEIRFIREIVHPSGCIESDDRPKQLPAPDASTDDTNEGAA